MALLIPSENSTPEVSAAAIGEELSGSRETRQGLQKSSWRQGSGLEQALEKDRSGQISGGVAKDRTTIQLVQKETNTSNHGASGSKISYVSASDGRTL